MQAKPDNPDIVMNWRPLFCRMARRKDCFLCVTGHGRILAPFLDAAGSGDGPMGHLLPQLEIGGQTVIVGSVHVYSTGIR